MKRMLSMVLAVLLLAVSLFSASAGEGDNLFTLGALGITLAVPESAVIMTAEEIAETNDNPSSPSDPVALLGMTVPEAGITFLIGERVYEVEEDFQAYAVAYTSSLLQQGGNPDDLEITESNFVGAAAVQVAYGIGNIGILSFLIPCELGVMVILIAAPVESFENGSVSAFLMELVAPMRGE